MLAEGRQDEKGLNRRGKVLKTEALNEEAKALADGLQAAPRGFLKKDTLAEALQKTMELQRTMESEEAFPHDGAPEFRLVEVRDNDIARMESLQKEAENLLNDLNPPASGNTEDAGSAGNAESTGNPGGAGNADSAQNAGDAPGPGKPAGPGEGSGPDDSASGPGEGGGPDEGTGPGGEGGGPDSGAGDGEGHDRGNR